MEEQTSLTGDTEPSDQPAERRRPAPRPTDSSATVLALIERLAADSRADVAKLDRMMALYERLRAKDAELAYNAAKGRILKKLAGIRIVKNRAALYEIDSGKPQKGTYEAFKYAPLEEINKHLRPLLAEEEMDLSYSDEPVESAWSSCLPFGKTVSSWRYSASHGARSGMWTKPFSIIAVCEFMRMILSPVGW
jgi:hypothetical protein